MILTPSNVLSLTRGPLAFLFLLDHPFYRMSAIIMAMITDSLDGYLARRWRMTSQLGATLDPLMDKFFVFFIVAIFLQEGKLQLWQALAFISRDFAILIFSCYLAFKGAWSTFKVRSIWSGKITTTLQFFILIALLFEYPLPNYFFAAFISLGISALFELYFIEKQLFA